MCTLRRTGKDVEAVDTKVPSVNALPHCVFHTHWISPHTFGQVKAASDRADYDKYIQLCYLRLPKGLHCHHNHMHMQQWHEENPRILTFEQWQAFSIYEKLHLPLALFNLNDEM